MIGWSVRSVGPGSAGAVMTLASMHSVWVWHNAWLSVWPIIGLLGPPGLTNQRTGHLGN